MKGAAVADSTHTYHPDSHTEGLADTCPRCFEHSSHPFDSLDMVNIARLKRGDIKSALDKRAAENMQTDLQRAQRIVALWEGCES